MRVEARITSTSEIEIDVETAALWFAWLSDDDKAEFLVKISDLMAKFSPELVQRQWEALGGHLRWCRCATPAVRAMVREWARQIEISEHGRDGRLAKE